MPDQIYIGNFSKGFQSNILPFNLDNDTFATLFNFYAWRGRVKRKRGTLPLGRLQVQVSIATMPAVYQVASFNLAAGAGNLINQYSLAAGTSISSVALVIGGATFSDSSKDGTLTETVTITGATPGQSVCLNGK